MEDIFSLDTGSCPIEEEIPAVEHEEVTPPVGESQPHVASASVSPSTWRFS
jgi:hypothetical protein